MRHDNKRLPDALDGNFHPTVQSEPLPVDPNRCDPNRCDPNHALRLVATRLAVFGWASSEARCTAAVSYLLSFEQPVEEPES